MSALLFYLTRYPECYQHLEHEIRSTFASATDIKFGIKLSSCPYLRACIDETLRMSPPIPGTMWRELQPNDNKPLVIDGHVVPPGTQVGVNTYSLHHNKEYFPDPHVFNPERWLNSETDGRPKDTMLEVFMPFSIGYRDCAGKNMAYLVMMSLVVAKILWYFDFELPNGDIGKVGGGKEGGQYGRERKNEYQLCDMFSAAQ